MGAFHQCGMHGVCAESRRFHPAHVCGLVGLRCDVPAGHPGAQTDADRLSDFVDAVTVQVGDHVVPRGEHAHEAGDFDLRPGLFLALPSPGLSDRFPLLHSSGREGSQVVVHTAEQKQPPGLVAHEDTRRGLAARGRRGVGILPVVDPAGAFVCRLPREDLPPGRPWSAPAGTNSQAAPARSTSAAATASCTADAGPPSSISTLPAVQDMDESSPWTTAASTFPPPDPSAPTAAHPALEAPLGPGAASRGRGDTRPIGGRWRGRGVPPSRVVPKATTAAREEGRLDCRLRVGPSRRPGSRSTRQASFGRSASPDRPKSAWTSRSRARVVSVLRRRSGGTACAGYLPC